MRGKKIALCRQLADLAVQLFGAGLIGLLAGLLLALEEVRRIVEQFSLPGADHSRMHLEPGCNLGCGLVALEGPARATLDLKDALYCLRFLPIILLLVEMMNQSLDTCPKFGVQFIQSRISIGVERVIYGTPAHRQVGV